MINIEQAKKLTTNDIVYVAEIGSDKRPKRIGINGKIKLWKTRPLEFSIPWKHGLYTYGYITDTNNYLFYIDENEALQKANK